MAAILSRPQCVKDALEDDHDETPRNMFSKERTMDPLTPASRVWSVRIPLRVSGV